MGARRIGIPARRMVAVVFTVGLGAAAAGCGAAGKDSGTGTRGRGGAGGAGNPGLGVPAKDSFEGPLRSGTGAYAGAAGRARVYLRPEGAGARRSVTITLVGLPCAGASHCLALSGTVHGALAAGPRAVPDVGHGYVLTGAGLVRPIGRVSVRGGVTGTGFIIRGQETLTLTLTGASGSVSLIAMSPTVHGFTSP